MTETLVLSVPTSKGIEHEKWQAMVESVIEFITASKTMLQVLNERMKESEKLNNEDGNLPELEDEKIKIEFYNEFLNSGWKPEEKSVTQSRTLSDAAQKNDEVGEKEDEKRCSSTSGIQVMQNNSILSREGKKFKSKIPRTKSNADESKKHYAIECTHNEGTSIGSSRKSRKSEVGYSFIHQRTKSKAPKGDEN